MIGAPELSVLDNLYDKAFQIKTLIPNSRWYLFGSITTSKREVGDIDILVVCKTSAECAMIRAELTSICSQFPIHLLLMTVREEAEVKFIKGQSAIEICVAQVHRLTDS